MGGGKPAFTIISRGKTTIKKFNILAEEVLVQLHPCNGENILLHYQNIIQQLVDYFKKDTHPTDKIGIVIRNSKNPSPLALSFRLSEQLDAEALWGLIYRAVQSNAEFLMEGTLLVRVHIVRAPRGDGRNRSRVYATKQDFVKSNGGIIEILNNDNRCLAYAVVVGLALLENVPNVKHLQQDKTRMEEKVEELLELAGLTLDEGGSIEELNVIQQVLPPEIQLVVFNDVAKKSLFFKGDVIDAKKHIYLYLHDGHFDVIKSICQFFCCSYFCIACYKPHDNYTQHRCIYQCSGCRKNPICIKSIKTPCEDCNKEFVSLECYQNHKQNFVNRTQTVCDYYKRCTQCCRTYTMYKNRKNHKCDEIFCNTCKTHTTRDHQCYIQVISKDIKSPKETLFVFFDTECTLNTNVSEKDSDGTLHICNLIIAHSQCIECINIDDINIMCRMCGIRKHIFIENPVQSFFEFLCLPRKHFKSIYIFSHNFRGYDSMPILRYMIETMQVHPALIMRGTQVISADHKSLHFRDTLNFLPMSLSKMPACLGLQESLEKGRYPYLFNTNENFNYVGAMPPIEMFDPGNMSRQERTKFQEWYDEKVVNNYTFNNREELIKYCDKDVEILRKCSNKFREIMIEIGGVDPLLECVTLAQCAFTIFRRHFLPPNTLGIIPNKGYRWVDTQSKKAIKWLITQERLYDRKIAHAGNGREVTLPNGMRVDGYLELFGEKIVFEFLGCVYHSCPKCFVKNNVKFKNNFHENTALNAEATERKLKVLKLHNYKVITKWECEFDAELQADKELKDFVDNHPLIKMEALNPRDAMFGGRTEAIRIYAESDAEHCMPFVDFCSLYPYAMKYLKVPIKHPKIHLPPDFPDVQNIDGLIKCDILPPNNLFLPLLPARINKKLMFVLCRKCAEIFNQQKCSHSDDERMLSGTWVVSEVQKAIQLNYKLIRIHEIWEYEVQEYSVDGDNSLFVKYINKMLKVKQMNSGFPQWVQNEEDKKKYVEQYFKDSGILLDIEKITNNPGMRSNGKFLLNSLFGRLALNPDKSLTEIVTSAFRFYNMLADPNIDVNSITPCGEESLIVNYDIPDELKPTCSTINIVAAAFITAGARLRLYSCLEKMPGSVCYMDTDSILLHHPKNKDSLPTGNNLGDLESEVPDGLTLKRYVSGGPKCYAYELENDKNEIVKSVIKIKGITQNSSNDHIVNFTKLKDMVLNSAEPEYVTYPRKIHRTKDFNIISKQLTKIFQPVNNKRRIIPGSYITLPYGYYK